MIIHIVDFNLLGIESFYIAGSVGKQGFLFFVVVSINTLKLRGPHYHYAGPSTCHFNLEIKNLF